MEITLKGDAYIRGYSPEQGKRIKGDLTLANPAFAQAKNMDLSIWGIPMNIKYYTVLPDKSIMVPMGYMFHLTTWLENEFTIEDFRKAPEGFYERELEFLSTPRDYQLDISHTLMDRTMGTIRSKTGSGKTLSFIYFILLKKRRTLILVNTTELLDQTIAAFCTHTSLTPEDIGVIKEGKADLKPITVGTIQSMYAFLKDKKDIWKKVNDYFSQVISDEVHIIPASTYFEVITNLETKYKFGFSATPQREDGLTDVIFLATGPIVHDVPDAEVDKYLVKPTYAQIETDYYFPLMQTTEYTSMLSHMAEDQKRNNFIVEKFHETNPNKDLSCILCNRKSQIEILADLLPNAAMLHSGMKKKERVKVMEGLRDGTYKVVVSSFGLFSTGIDLPELAYMYLVSPIKSFIKLKQSGGRLMRKSKGKVEKKAKIFDFVDTKISLLKNQARIRKRVLTNL